MGTTRRLCESGSVPLRWDIIDSYARPWIAAGKQIGFRITCCEARYPFATPEWVKASGAKGWFFKMTPMHKIFGRDPAEGGSELWEPATSRQRSVGRWWTTAIACPGA